MTVVLALLLPVSASGVSDLYALPREYGEMLASLPDTLREALPESVLSADPAEVAEAWRALTSPRALVSLVLEALGVQGGRTWRMLLGVIGVLLLRAVYACFCSSIRAGGVARGAQLVCRTVLFCLLIGQAMTLLEGVVGFFQSLQALTGAYLPLMGAMYALGGNVSAAVANQSTLMLAFLLVEWLGGRTVVPLFCLCLAFSMLGAFESSVAGRMQTLTGRLKKWYATALALVMLLLSGALAAQTTLASRADSLGFRAVRFAVSSSIPMVGGGVAEMLRTAATSVSWMRGVVGVSGIVLLLWLLLPQLVSLLLARWALTVAEDVAAWLGCGEEGRLIGEIGGLCGYLLAVVSVSVMTFFFALVLLLKCGAAFA